MQWCVTYVVPYPDFSRNGRTACANREDAFSWITHAKEHRNFLEVVVWCGPKFVRRWKMEELYVVRGKRYKWVVYKPSTGTKYYVRKKSLANDKNIGKDHAYVSSEVAKRAADRAVQGEGRFV